MKSESGSASHGTAFKLAASFVVFFGLIAIWHALSRRDIRPTTVSDMKTQPTERSETDAGPAESSETDTPPTERRAAGARVAPVQVEPFRGQYCASLGPAGWSVLDENPQRSSVGADLASGDRLAYAGYLIFPSGSMASPGSETPERAVAATLSSFGTIEVRYGAHRQVGPNVFLLEYLTATNHGVAFYQVVPAGGDGAMIVMRLAGTSASPGQWESRGAEAMAVARSLVCQVPYVPPGPDPPGLNAKTDSGSNNGEEADTLYNTWLETEYYHNPKNGENYWVSPTSGDYSQTGPEGPGYYATYGNSLIKLAPGYAQ